MLRAMSVCSDVLCLVETRHTAESLDSLDKVAKGRGWHGRWGQTRNSGHPKAGVALFSRIGRPIALTLPHELQEHADEGNLM
eukprot:3616939-Amphidinium_carterae.1